MAKKKMEDYTIEELRKFHKFLKTIFIVELTILIGGALFILYSKITNTFNLTMAIYMIPVMMAAVMMGPLASMKIFRKELERRGETI